MQITEGPPEGGWVKNNGSLHHTLTESQKEERENVWFQQRLRLYLDHREHPRAPKLLEDLNELMQIAYDKGMESSHSP